MNQEELEELDDIELVAAFLQRINDYMVIKKTEDIKIAATKILEKIGKDNIKGFLANE